MTHHDAVRPDGIARTPSARADECCVCLECAVAPCTLQCCRQRVCAGCLARWLALRTNWPGEGRGAVCPHCRGALDPACYGAVVAGGLPARVPVLI